VRLQAAISGDLGQLLAAELQQAERAVTTGVRQATVGLQTELRSQVTAAGLGPRLARAWRSRVYPETGTSLTAAGVVWTKAPRIIGAFAQTTTIRSKRSLYLAIPTPAAGRYGDGRRKITPWGGSVAPGSGCASSTGGTARRCWSPTTRASPVAARPSATPAGGVETASPGSPAAPPCRSSSWCRR
jgi:hypothetical protein